jgi:hypothetical protein
MGEIAPNRKLPAPMLILAVVFTLPQCPHMARIALSLDFQAAVLLPYAAD